MRRPTLRLGPTGRHTLFNLLYLTALATAVLTATPQGVERVVAVVTWIMVPLSLAMAGILALAAAMVKGLSDTKAQLLSPLEVELPNMFGSRAADAAFDLIVLGLLAWGGWAWTLVAYLIVVGANHMARKSLAYVKDRQWRLTQMAIEGTLPPVPYEEGGRPW